MTTAAVEPSSTGLSKARVEALSDGVFAIAMTLLVLELKVPQLPRHASAAELGHALRTMGPTFFSFFVTFMLAGQFWFWQQTVWQFTRDATRVLFLVNLVFLMFVSLLPFSTAMLGAFTLSQPVSLAFYFANQLALSVLLNVHWRYAWRHGLVPPEASQPAGRRFATILTFHPLVCVATMAAIPVNPQWCFLIYTIAMAFMGVVAKRRSR